MKFTFTSNENYANVHENVFGHTYEPGYSNASFTRTI